MLLCWFRITNKKHIVGLRRFYEGRIGKGGGTSIQRWTKLGLQVGFNWYNTSWTIFFFLICLFFLSWHVLGCNVRFNTYKSQQPGRGKKIGWTALRGVACRRLLKTMGGAIASSTQIFNPQHVQLLSRIWNKTARYLRFKTTIRTWLRNFVSHFDVSTSGCVDVLTFQHTAFHTCPE